MQEQGKVVSVNGKIATVEVDKKDECSKCGMCLFPQNAKSVSFEVKNTLCAKVGDIVTFNTQKQGNLLGAILVFLNTAYFNWFICNNNVFFYQD